MSWFMQLVFDIYAIYVNQHHNPVFLGSEESPNHHQKCCALISHPFSSLLWLQYFWGLNDITSPCMLSSHVWPSSLPGGRCPSSAPQGTASLPEDFPCRLYLPTVHLWSLGSSAPRTGLSCCCSRWAASGWRRLWSGDRNCLWSCGWCNIETDLVSVQLFDIVPFTWTLAQVLDS